MSWHQKALKGVEDCEKPGETVKRVLIPEEQRAGCSVTKSGTLIRNRDHKKNRRRGAKGHRARHRVDFSSAGKAERYDPEGF
jgi:hypothetical protein